MVMFQVCNSRMRMNERRKLTSSMTWPKCTMFTFTTVHNRLICYAFYSGLSVYSMWLDMRNLVCAQRDEVLHSSHTLLLKLTTSSALTINS